MASEAHPVISASQLDSTFGCLFLGGIFTSILWGVGCLQLWIYYETHSRTDQRWLKIYVFSIWAVDVAHQVIVVHYLYSAFVKGIANPLILGRGTKTFYFIAVITGVVDAMVQCIFLQRVWFVSGKKRLVTGILSALVLGQFAVTMVYFGQIYNFTELAQLATAVHTELIMNSITALTDTLLAVTLIYFLWRSRTGFRKTDTIVNRLIAYSIGTGLITALWAITALIGAEVAPNTFFYLLVDLVVPKLYFNCMLASLNARSGLRETLANAEEGSSIHLPGSAAKLSSNVSTGFPRKTSGARPFECSVRVETESRGDHQQKGEITVLNFDAASASSV